MADKKSSYVVGCKLPNGLVIRGAGKQVRLNGKNHQIIAGGFGLTHGVPADIWEDFERTHKQSNVIKNGIVFAVGDDKSARAAAKEREEVKTGLEQVDPKKTATKQDKE